MGAQIAVLVDESIQSVPLLLRRYDNATGEGVGQENDLALAARDIDEVVAPLAIAVHVGGIDERVTVAPVAREPVPLVDLQERAAARFEAWRTAFGIHRGDEGGV